MPSSGVLTQACDARDPKAVGMLVDRAVATFGGSTHSCSRRARAIEGISPKTTDDQWRAEFEMKIFGVLHPLRAAMPHLHRSDGPRLVIINAVLARRPETAMIAVGTARAAHTTRGRIGVRATKVGMVGCHSGSCCRVTERPHGKLVERVEVDNMPWRLCGLGG